MFKVVMKNDLPITFTYSLLRDNRLKYLYYSTPGSGMDTGEVSDGDVIVIRAKSTGGFITAFTCASNKKEVVIGPTSITLPNRIGNIPKPNAKSLIPPNGMNIVVGVGRVYVGQENNQAVYNSIVKEQFWQRMPDSYSLFPGQTDTISMTTSTGRQSVSSSNDQIAASVNASAHAGWGPIGASISSSLSMGSSTFQQVTMTEQQQTYRSKLCENKTDKPQIYFVWQITDIVTVSSPGGEVLSTLVSVEAPAVIYGPYDPSDLPDPDPAEEIIPTGYLVGEPVSSLLGP